jgi:hypothetical protein
MRGIAPNKRIWEKVNQAILGENAAVALVTIISGLCGLLKQSGVCATEDEARAQLAAMLLSPDKPGAAPGSLVPLLQVELEKIRGRTDTWWT